MNPYTEYQREYREKNREAIKAYDRKRYANLSEEDKQKRNVWSKKSYEKNKNKILIKMRKRHLQLVYNLSAEQYLSMMIEQQNRCAICGEYEKRYTKTGDIKPLSVDHNHITGEIRGLLCNDCNALIGFANEDKKILENAISYLEMYFQADRRDW